MSHLGLIKRVSTDHLYLGASLPVWYNMHFLSIQYRSFVALGLWFRLLEWPLSTCLWGGPLRAAFNLSLAFRHMCSLLSSLWAIAHSLSNDGHKLHVIGNYVQVLLPFFLDMFPIGEAILNTVGNSWPLNYFRSGTTFVELKRLTFFISFIPASIFSESVLNVSVIKYYIIFLIYLIVF